MRLLPWVHPILLLLSGITLVAVILTDGDFGYILGGFLYTLVVTIVGVPRRNRRAGLRQPTSKPSRAR